MYTGNIVFSKAPAGSPFLYWFPAQSTLSTPVHKDNIPIRASPSASAPHNGSMVSRAGVDWAGVQARRLRALQGSCTRLRLHSWTGSLDKLLSTDHGQYLVNVQHKTMFCAIPKVASSTLKAALANVTGKLQMRAVSRHPDIVHKRFVYQKGGVEELRRYSHSQVRYMVENYTKFLFVRHPVIRFVSAFRDKVQDEDKRLGDLNPNVFQRNSFQSATNSTRHRSQHVTFESFVEWFITKQQMDPHWDHYHRLCLPCYLHYDYIGKVETLHTDLQHIMTQIYGPNVAESMYVRSLNAEHQQTDSVVNAYLGQLSPELLRAVQEVYATDQQMFGYETLVH